MSGNLNTPEGFTIALVTLAAVAAACAALSVFVVLLKWSFLGEGISHAGFAGAGTAALLAAVFPALDSIAAGFAVSVLFCFATAGAIGAVARRRGVSGDAAIGAFIVASLAWGAVAYSIRPGSTGGLQSYLFGSVTEISPAVMMAAISTCVIVLLLVAMLGREFLFYSFDTTLAQVSGVPVAVIHYVLVLLIAFAIIATMKLVGYLLAPAFVILPGALALAVSVRLRTVFALAITSSIAAVAVGLALAARLHFVEAGAAIVLVLFVEFLLAIAIRGR
jgi:ABC-type Mn2+/Zn2+ transport system permease subunit